ncbi:MAG TPA: hypothetical protein VFI73_04865 [Candidatus Nitrosopolaris sp.]|nr:hypothetical protein [Candidatus Nitrosopolaris sp.]
MQKSPVLVTMALITATAMFVSGITPTHIAKASTCSSSASIGLTVSTSTTKISCSTGSAFSRSVGASTSHGGSASSCTSMSTTSRPGFGFNSIGKQDSSGAVSCGSHSP